MELLKAGLIGLGRGGQRVADALHRSGWCRLTAVASPQAKRRDHFREANSGIGVYDDFRSLIVESALDVLFVAVPPFRRVAFLAVAAQRGLPVWMLTPAARNLEEAIKLSELFSSHACPIAVSRWWQAEDALQSEVIGSSRLGRLFMARGRAVTSLPTDLDWRGDSARAGGGVLLDRAYGLIDLAVQVMGVPTRVYAATGRIARPGTRFPYDTDDTAAMVWHFDGGAIATFDASWSSGPLELSLTFHGSGGTVRVDADRVALYQPPDSGEPQLHPRPENLLVPQIERFLQALRSNPRAIQSPLRDHLATMAVIDSAYLSARTGQPESPQTILQMHHVAAPARGW